MCHGHLGSGTDWLVGWCSTAGKSSQWELIPIALQQRRLYGIPPSWFQTYPLRPCATKGIPYGTSIVPPVKWGSQYRPTDCCGKSARMLLLSEPNVVGGQWVAALEPTTLPMFPSVPSGRYLQYNRPQWWFLCLERWLTQKLAQTENSAALIPQRA